MQCKKHGDIGPDTIEICLATERFCHKVDGTKESLGFSEETEVFCVRCWSAFLKKNIGVCTKE